MRISWYFAGAIAGTAFLLSAISAAFAGVPFGVLLMRALVSGVLFGGAGIGAELLVQSQLPELYALLRGESAEESENSSQEAGTGGENVDIVLESEEEGEFGAGPLSGDEDATNTEEGAPIGGDEFVEEVEEVSSDGVEESEPIVPPQEEAAETEEPGSGDDLPNIGEFSETFQEDRSNQSSATDQGSNIGNLGESSGQGPQGSGNEDPAAIARAIQTVLKREE